MIADVVGVHDRCRTPVRKAIGETALALGVWVEGLYLSLRHGQVRRGGASISVLKSVVVNFGEGDR